MPIVQESSNTTELDESVDALRRGATALQGMPIDKRLDLISQCIAGVGKVARQWVQTGCEAKRIDDNSPARTEEVAAGPLPTIRFLQLISRTLKDVQTKGVPTLPGPVQQRHGQCRVPVLPTRQLYDSIFFRPITAETWLHPDVQPDRVSSESAAQLVASGEPKVIVVLGAGNVTSIPATDALTKIFIENSAVVLKMNPVNDYLGPLLASAFKPLLDANLLRLAYGGIETGTHLIQHDSITGVHITGSIHSHDNIAWGADANRERRRRDNQPLLQKSITSELGNVSPWAIVPGEYSESELRGQAETVASSIANNVSFNCIATKLILTCRGWPQRERFLDLVDGILQATPRRYAYYPGAAQRYERFSGVTPDDPDRLPFTLLRSIDPKETPHLLREESFAPVCGEMIIDADNDVEFLYKATEVMNNDVWGTLAATLTLPQAFEDKHAAELDENLRKLRFGTIAINQWPALSFALMSPPWGGHPSTNLQDAESGIGFVHNTYLLDRPEKTVLRGPLWMTPKPIWHSHHRHPERVVWDMLQLYERPSLLKVAKVVFSALTG